MIGLAELVVALAGLWLVGLAALMMFKPARAERLLTTFASSARAHYTEQALRLVAGSAIVVVSDDMLFANFFTLFGWTIVATALGLLLIPWKWHHRYGKWAIPLAIRNLKLYGLGALFFGAFVLYALLW